MEANLLTLFPLFYRDLLKIREHIIFRIREHIPNLIVRYIHFFYHHYFVKAGQDCVRHIEYEGFFRRISFPVGTAGDDFQ